MKQKDIRELKKALNRASKVIDVKADVEHDRIKEEQERILNEWKALKTELIDIKEFQIPKKLIRVIINTDDYFALTFVGAGGLGKTYLTLNEVKQLLKPDEWCYFNGYTTPLSLYETLYKNRNAKLIILDDVEGIFNNPISVSILKSALWESNGKRLVQYNTKSEKAKDLVSIFEIKAKLIILCNAIPNEKDLSISAMKSRTIFYKFHFDYKTILRILKLLLSKRDGITDKQKNDVYGIITENTNQATDGFNFRTLMKAIAFIKSEPNDAEELFKATTEIDEKKQKVLELMKSGLDTKAQVTKFVDEGYGCRATYFNIKRSLKV